MASLPQNIRGIASKLAEDVTEQIQPHRCVFESTKEGTTYHYKVCRVGTQAEKRKREKVIAWADVRKRGGIRFRVSLIRELLGATAIVSYLVPWNGYSYGQVGRRESYGETWKVGDAGYQVLLEALILAANAWL